MLIKHLFHIDASLVSQYFKEEYGKKEELPKGKSQIIYQSENAIVRWPEDEEAACYLGQGTQWCTATTQAENFFDDYDNEGPLAIINFAKPFTIFDMQYGGSAEFGGDEGPGEEKRIHKIQIHFTNEDYGNDEEYYHPGEWEPTQIADAQDKPLDFNNQPTRSTLANYLEMYDMEKVFDIFGDFPQHYLFGLQ